jgi:hypothetical protein
MNYVRINERKAVKDVQENKEKIPLRFLSLCGLCVADTSV